MLLDTEYFKFPKLVNCGTPGDKTQYVLRRAENLPIPSSVKFVAIHCGTNNLDYDDPNIISKGILSIAKTRVKKACKSNMIITGLLPRDKSKSKRRSKLLKVNSYLSNFCKNEKNMLFMGQGEGLILHDNILDESLYYGDHIHLLEPGNATFTLNISNAINIFSELKYYLQLKVSRQLSAKPPLTFVSKPLPTTSPLKPLPPIVSPPIPVPPISPPNPLPKTSTSKALPTTSPHKPPTTTSPHKPLLTTLPPKSLPTTSPLKPAPPNSPHKPLPTASPHKPISPTSLPYPLPPTSPSKPLLTTSPPRTPTTTSPSKPITKTLPHKPLPTTSPLLSSLVKTKLKLNKSNGGFYIFTFLRFPFCYFY